MDLWCLLLFFEKISKEGDEIKKSGENPKYRLLKRYVLQNYLWKVSLSQSVCKKQILFFHVSSFSHCALSFRFKTRRMEPFKVSCCILSLSLLVHCLMTVKLTLWNRHNHQPTRLNVICFWLLLSITLVHCWAYKSFSFSFFVFKFWNDN